MVFEYDLTVPADTSASSPAEQDLRLARGIIHKIDVAFPFGCNNAVLVTINRALHQVFPTNPDGQLKASGYTISGPVWEELEEAPYQLTARGWSPGTSYPHKITIRLFLLPREVLQPPRAEVGLLERLARFVGVR